MTSAREVIARALEPKAFNYQGNILTADSKRQVALCRADTILAALEAEGLAVVRSDFVASKMVDAAHFLLCYNYQGFAKDDPPRDRGGNCIWRVWHLAPEARDHMTAAEQELFDTLMPQFPAAAKEKSHDDR